MNDLDLLRECAPEAPLLSSAELSEARHRVLTDNRAGPGRFRPRRSAAAGGTAARPSAPHRDRWRYGGRRRRDHSRSARGDAPDTPAPVTVPAMHRTTPAPVTVPATLTAREVLEHAAAAALKEPAVVPRDDQFVYTKVVGAGGVVELSWLSVDGTRNGLTEITDEREDAEDGAARVRERVA